MAILFKVVIVTLSLTYMLSHITEPVYGKNLNDGVASISCIGPVGGKPVIYLHGMDVPSLSKTEQQTRKVLRHLAVNQRLRIALPRSARHCRRLPQKRCWNFGRSMAAKVYQDVVASARNCFLEKDFLLLGHSEGGYYVSKLVQFCIPHQARAIIAIGSAGSFHASDPQQLKNCGKLYLLIGDKEITRPKTDRYYHHLKKLGASVSLQEFSGGHIVPQLPLEKLIQTLK